jgi:hypothetical protein
VLRKLRRRNQDAGAEHRKKLIHQTIELQGYHRKSAIRALSFVQTERGRQTNAGRPALSLNRTGDAITITFTGNLQSSTSIRGAFSNVTGSASPDAVPAPSGGSRFYRSIK